MNARGPRAQFYIKRLANGRSQERDGRRIGRGRLRIGVARILRLID
jgi:hypothetical protein